MNILRRAIVATAIIFAVATGTVATASAAPADTAATVTPVAAVSSQAGCKYGLVLRKIYWEYSNPPRYSLVVAMEDGSIRRPFVKKWVYDRTRTWSTWAVCG